MCRSSDQVALLLLHLTLGMLPVPLSGCKFIVLAFDVKTDCPPPPHPRHRSQKKGSPKTELRPSELSRHQIELFENSQGTQSCLGRDYAPSRKYFFVAWESVWSIVKQPPSNKTVFPRLSPSLSRLHIVTPGKTNWKLKKIVEDHEKTSNWTLVKCVCFR